MGANIESNDSAGSEKVSIRSLSMMMLTIDGTDIGYRRVVSEVKPAV